MVLVLYEATPMNTPGNSNTVKYRGQMVEALGKMIARGAVRVDICSTFTR